MKKYLNNYLTTSLLVLALVLALISCGSEFLEYSPKGVVSDQDLEDPANIELLVNAAYASLGNDDAHRFGLSHTTNWLWGSVRSDDAYKGGQGQTDQSGLDRLERFTPILVDQEQIHRPWLRFYEAIERANLAIRTLNLHSEDALPNKQQRIAEMRFLRGHHYFRLIKFWKNVPWIDENTERNEYNLISNRQYTRDELYDKIAEDFQFGMNILPEFQNDLGRASAVAAASYLAKTRLYQAYEQDEQHNVVTINTKRLEEVVELIDYVINSGKHSLNDDFAENWLPEFQNSAESVFAIQFSQDDGTSNGRRNFSHNLNYGMNAEYGCCSFHQPSHNLVNAFKTNKDGIPLFNSFNDTWLSNPEDYNVYNFDPRVGHTIGIPGHPFKYDPNLIYESSWVSSVNTYGPHLSMKEAEHPDSPYLRTFGSRRATSRNWDIIRFSDVLLWKAEALIELGRQDEALPIINNVRKRAQNSTNRLQLDNGTYALTYNVDIYIPEINIEWTQENAREALRFERRLEFAAESPRFFDLVRWGIAAEIMNDYISIEKNRRPFLEAASFTKNRNEYLPIPQAEIVISEGLYQQNPGY